MQAVRAIVVMLSDAFEDFWQELATDLGVEVTSIGPGDACTVTADVASVLVAAGGAEPEALEWLDSSRPSVEVPLFVVGSDPGRRIATQLLRHGAADYFALPEDLELMRNTLGAVTERRRQLLRQAAGGGDAAREAFGEILGESPAIREALARTARVLQHSDSTALIVGETGTGKELLARALHEGSSRRGAPFVAVNCSALPSHLAESELFGHERGAFTDAHAPKPGLFEMADGGTLLLDEIGTLPLELQSKLLRTLDDKQVRRVGGTRSRKVDVRIIAATNEDLEQAMKRGAFRHDLYYRLSVITLRLPPLRQRGEDAVVIANALLKRLARQYGVPVPRLTPDTVQAMLRYPWPGNVRELKNAVERALLLSAPGELSLRELLPAQPADAPPADPLPFPADLRDITAAAARATLDSCGGNRSEAARRLGVSRKRLRRLLDHERNRE
ncbi:MAG: sigma-54-dependent Fis family transcriptional regulator [Gemmatimonadetes bacterium]|nr:sigma-54-dependent Fis family transcriptional regulator [Gemmatimonadota bacterium]